MIYENILKKLEDFTDTQELLKEYKHTFEMIEEYGNNLHNGTLDTPLELDTAISELGSVYTSLTVVVNLCEGHKMKKEEDWKESKRQKVLDNSAQELHYYRQIRNIFKGYKDGCDRLISICQTKLKQIEREKTLG